MTEVLKLTTRTSWAGHEQCEVAEFNMWYYDGIHVALAGSTTYRFHISITIHLFLPRPVCRSLLLSSTFYAFDTLSASFLVMNCSCF